MRPLRACLAFAAIGALAAAAPHHQGSNDRRRDTLHVGATGACAPFPTTTVELQPVYYSEIFPFTTVVDIFRDGSLFTVSEAPTTVVVQSTLTRTILPLSETVPSGSDGRSSSTSVFTTSASASMLSGPLSRSSSTSVFTTSASASMLSGSLSGTSSVATAANPFLPSSTSVVSSALPSTAPEGPLPSSTDTPSSILTTTVQSIGGGFTASTSATTLLTQILTPPTSMASTGQSTLTTTVPIQVSPASTSVVAVATTSALPAPLPPPPACGNEGVAFAVYRVPFDVQVGFFKANPPEQVGVTPDLGFAAFGSSSIYGGPPFFYEFGAVNHRGFVYASLTGTYSITVPSSDDITLVWIGDVAYTAYEQENAVLEVAAADQGATFTVDLVAGQYLPFRVLTVNGFDSGLFTIRITDPNGNVIIGDDSTNVHPYVVQFACGGQTPIFPPFGQAIPPPLPPPPTCNNQGLAFAVQSHGFFNADAPAFSSVQVEYFKTAGPLQIGVTTTVGFAAYESYSYYGGPLIDPEYKAVNHRGYIYAPITGSYRFRITDSDDITFVWLGPNAYSSYSRENANLEQDYAGQGVDYTVTLQAGTYTPIRILAVNGQVTAVFSMEITAPDGSSILSAGTVSNPYIIQYGCNEPSAPMFEPFGAEYLIG